MHLKPKHMLEPTSAIAGLSVLLPLPLAPFEQHNVPVNSMRLVSQIQLTAYKPQGGYFAARIKFVKQVAQEVFEKQVFK